MTAEKQRRRQSLKTQEVALRRLSKQRRASSPRRFSLPGKTPAGSRPNTAPVRTLSLPFNLLKLNTALGSGQRGASVSARRTRQGSSSPPWRPSSPRPSAGAIDITLSSALGRGEERGNPFALVGSPTAAASSPFATFEPPPASEDSFVAVTVRSETCQPNCMCTCSVCVLWAVR